MSQYSITWDSYKNNICNGFVELQQKEEFVDMTIAADGHFVKVHKNLIALASPYLKQLMSALPAKNPVIFLHNISHDILNYILEYIYIGEIKLPDTKVLQFIAAGKSLHLSGILDMIPPQTAYIAQDNVTNIPKPQPAPSFKPAASEITQTNNDKFIGSNEWTITPLVPFAPGDISNQKIVLQNVNINSQTNMSGISNKVAGISNNTPDISNNIPGIGNNVPGINNNIPVISNNIPGICNNVPGITNNTPVISNNIPGIGNNIPGICNNMPDINNDIGISNIQSNSQYTSQTLDNSLSMPNINITIDGDKDESCISNINAKQSNMEDLDDDEVITIEEGNTDKQNENKQDEPRLQFTVSALGSIQLILNRFVYFTHYKQKKLIRWRCVDYRRKRCTAYVDTNPTNTAVLARKNPHTHPYHDRKILKKIQDNLVFPTAECFQDYKNTAKKKTTRSDDNARINMSDDESDPDVMFAD